MSEAKKRIHQTRPCENCPYRKDAPRGFWYREEFERLLASEEAPLGGLYACHKFKEIGGETRGVCAGWLLDQKKRGIPSIRLRIQLTQDPEVVKAYNEVSDGGHKMFVSVTAMCRANGVRKKVIILTGIPRRRSLPP